MMSRENQRRVEVGVYFGGSLRTSRGVLGRGPLLHKQGRECTKTGHAGVPTKEAREFGDIDSIQLHIREEGYSSELPPRSGSNRQEKSVA